MTTLQTLAKYRADLEKWKANGGPTGGGGAYDRKTKTNRPAAEPVLELSNAWLKPHIDKIRAEVLSKE